MCCLFKLRFGLIRLAFKVLTATISKRMQGAEHTLCFLLWVALCPLLGAAIDVEIVFPVQDSLSNPNQNTTDSNTTNSTPPSAGPAFNLSNFAQALAQDMPTKFNVTDGNTTKTFELSLPPEVQIIKSDKVLCVSGNCFDEAVYGNPPATTPPMSSPPPISSPPPTPTSTPKPTPSPSPQETSSLPLTAIVVSTVSLAVVVALVGLFLTRRASRQSLGSGCSIWTPGVTAQRIELRPVIKARITLPSVEKTGAQAAGGCTLALLPPAHYTIHA